MKRREAIKMVGLFALVASLPAACSWKSVFNAIREYVPVGLQAFLGVVGVLTGGGVISVGTNALIDAAIALVTKAFNDVNTAVTQYQQTPPVGTVATISAVLNAVSTSIGKFLTDIHVPDAQLAALVSGLINVILSTISGFQAQLPNQPAVLQAAAPHTYTVGSQTTTVLPRHRSLSQFKHDYNAVVEQFGHPEIALK
jgi:hypothetical protein